MNLYNVFKVCLAPSPPLRCVVFGVVQLSGVLRAWPVRAGTATERHENAAVVITSALNNGLDASLCGGPAGSLLAERLPVSGRQSTVAQAHETHVAAINTALVDGLVASLVLKCRLRRDVG
jgi:hypothetical protein